MTLGIVGISIQGVYFFSGWLGHRRLHAGGAKTGRYRRPRDTLLFLLIPLLGGEGNRGGALRGGAAW